MRGNSLDIQKLFIGGNPASGGGNNNLLINGNFDFWHRGATQTSNGYGSNDRWTNQNSGSTKVHSGETFTLGQTDVPWNPSFFARTVVTSVAGVNNYVFNSQRVEHVRFLSGKTVTLSFWAKADASKNIATGVLQFFGSGGSATVNGIGVTTHALTTSWQKFTATFTVPSAAGKTGGAGSFTQLEFWFDSGSTYNARNNSLGQQSGTFDIAQVKLEEGSVATPFEARPEALELVLCQRYYEKIFLGTYSGYCIGTTQADIPVHYDTTKRISPTATLNLTSLSTLSTSGSTQAVSSASVIGGGKNTLIRVTVASGLTNGRGTYLRVLSTNFISFDAEL